MLRDKARNSGMTDTEKLVGDVEQRARQNVPLKDEKI